MWLTSKHPHSVDNVVECRTQARHNGVLNAVGTVFLSLMRPRFRITAGRRLETRAVMTRPTHLYRRRTLVAMAAMLLALSPLPGLAAESPPGKPPDKPLEPWAATAPKDLAGLQAIEARVKTLVEKLLPTTVAVRVGAGQGSGVIVSKEGVTC